MSNDLPNSRGPNDSDPSDREIEQVLREMAARPRSASGDHDLAWRVAAGDGDDVDAHEAERQSLGDDPETMLELGVASALLEVRGRPHADARRSTDAVMRRIGLSPAANPWRHRSLLALAATALLALSWLWWRDSGPAIDWAATQVVARADRGGPADGMQFRVRLQPSTDSWPAVFVIAGGTASLDVRRLHPLRDDQRSSSAFARWPKGALPADVETVLPPTGMEPFQLATATAFLVLIEGGDAPFDEPRLLGMQSALSDHLAAGGSVVDEAAVQAAVVALAANGLRGQWRLVEVR